MRAKRSAKCKSFRLLYRQPAHLAKTFFALAEKLFIERESSLIVAF